MQEASRIHSKATRDREKEEESESKAGPHTSKRKLAVKAALMISVGLLRASRTRTCSFSSNKIKSALSSLSPSRRLISV